jgi:antitoxin component of MazEF toxin-antitoxin module
VQVQFAKWGNSLGVRIPSPLVRQLGLGEGVAAEISIQDGRLVLEPMASVPVYDIDDLVARITAENLPEEIGTGAAVGEEFW